MNSEKTQENNILLSVRDLRISFERQGEGRASKSVNAVRGVSFDVYKGETLGIVGESGSGKSVTVSAIPGLLAANARVSGSVKFEGRELLNAPPQVLRAYRGVKIGVIFQEPGGSFDPLQNMSGVFRETFRIIDESISKTESDARASELLAEVGLTNARERLRNFPHQFSGGQLQRINIALALAQNCALLIADEPTTALDVTTQAQIIALLRTLQIRRKISIIFITHDVDSAAAISQRLLVMYGGLVMEYGRAGEVIERPAHPYSKALLAAAPVFGAHYKKQTLNAIPGRPPDPGERIPGCPFAPRCSSSSARCAEELPPIVDLEAEDRRVGCFYAQGRRNDE